MASEFRWAMLFLAGISILALIQLFRAPSSLRRPPDYDAEIANTPGRDLVQSTDLHANDDEDSGYLTRVSILKEREAIRRARKEKNPDYPVIDDDFVLLLRLIGMKFSMLVIVWSPSLLLAWALTDWMPPFIGIEQLPLLLGLLVFFIVPPTISAPIMIWFDRPENTPKMIFIARRYSLPILVVTCLACGSYMMSHSGEFRAIRHIAMSCAKIYSCREAATNVSGLEYEGDVIEFLRSSKR